MNLLKTEIKLNFCRRRLGGRKGAGRQAPLPAKHRVYDFYREIPSNDVPTKWKNFYSHTCTILGAFSYFSPVVPMSFLCLCPRKVTGRYSLRDRVAYVFTFRIQKFAMQRTLTDFICVVKCFKTIFKNV